MKRSLVPGIFLVILTGCASLPLLEVGKDFSEDQKHYYYDVDSKIAYSVNRDDNNIYISIKTDNESTIRSLFGQGLYIYLDPNGRKNKDIYFNYPLTGKMIGPGGGPGGPGERGMMSKGQMQMQNGQTQTMDKPAFNVNELIENADMEAIFSYRDLAEKLPVYSQKTDIKVTLSSPKQGEFIYELRVPFDRLEKADISKLAIGIETGELDMPSMGGPGGGPGGDMMQGGSMQGGSMQGGPGGNMGGMQGGPGGGMQGRPGAGMEDISIWFEINLVPQTGV